MNKPFKTRAFTLVELLVVVAIIALLVSILLPSLGKAKEQARMVMCMSNLKGLNLGFVYYTQEHNEWYPKGASAGYDYETWDWVLKDYYGERGLLYCPSDPPNGDPVCYATRAVVWYPQIPEEDQWPRSYAISANASCTGPSDARPNQYPWPWNVGKATWIEIPGDTILLAECWYGSYYPGGGLRPGTYNRYDAAFTLTAWGPFLSSGWRETPDVHRNNEVANYLFCDGHVITLHKDNPNLTETTAYYYYERKKG